MRDEPLRYEVIDKNGEIGDAGDVLARFDKILIAEILRSKLDSLGVPTTLTATGGVR